MRACVRVAVVYSSTEHRSKYAVEEAGFDISAPGERKNKKKTSLIQYFRCRRSRPLLLSSEPQRDRERDVRSPERGFFVVLFRLREKIHPEKPEVSVA